ncbi:MAG: hypothetical protein EX263_08370 [Flavobacteriaceae bacterium]|nr:MAG: hypothetical protein EX263_08370 [Flavobacteriaceae bacterium]
MINGAINSTTSYSLFNHFDELLKIHKSLDIDIEHVHELDTNGLLVLYKLYMKAAILKYPFTISGSGCKEVYDEIEHSLACA